MTQIPSDTRTLNMIRMAEGMLSYWNAVLVTNLAKFAEYRPPGRAGIKLGDGAAEELAAVLNLSVTAARNRVLEAEQLVQRLPTTTNALLEGVIDMSRARATVQVTRQLSDEDAVKVEQAVLSKGPHASHVEYRRALRRQAMKVNPAAAERQRTQRLEDRDVVTRKAADGSVHVVAKLPPHVAHATFGVLNHLAHRAKTDDDTRTLAQRRADVLRDLVLGKDSERVRVNMNVTVPLTTLLGLNNQPGELSEHGPITAEHCRELAGDATLRRLVTDDFGHLLDVARDSYPSRRASDLIRKRDRTCRQPGCSVPERKCDIVHTAQCRGGCTTCDNGCVLLCKKHRLLRMRASGWTVVHLERGHFVFLTPGRQVRHVPVETFEEPAA